MTDNFSFFFHYLEKEKITIDKAEFIYQVQSHPDYPSLLAISDTLGKIALRDNFSQRTARLRQPVVKPSLLSHDVLPTARVPM